MVTEINRQEEIREHFTDEEMVTIYLAIKDKFLHEARLDYISPKEMDKYCNLLIKINKFIGEEHE